MSDVAVLKSLGYAATTPNELGKLSGKTLASFCEALECESDYDPLEPDVESMEETAELTIDVDMPETDAEDDNDEADDGDDPSKGAARARAVAEPSSPTAADSPEKAAELDLRSESPAELVLMGWYPSRWDLTVPPAIDSLKAHFSDLAKHLRLNLPELRVWQPRPEELNSLEFAMGHGAHKYVLGIVDDSIAGARQLFDAEVAPLSSPSELRANLRRRALEPLRRMFDNPELSPAQVTMLHVLIFELANFDFAGTKSAEYRELQMRPQFGDSPCPKGGVVPCDCPTTAKRGPLHHTRD